MQADSILLQRAESDVWDTPQWLFDSLDKEFGFTLDPCCDGPNAKCAEFYTPRENGLLRDWGTHIVFMNPPYSDVAEWMRKAYGAAQEGATVVCLVPARTDTVWWHEYAMKSEIRLLRGRLKFGDADNSAPFPTAIVVFRPREFKLVSDERVRGKAVSDGNWTTAMRLHAVLDHARQKLAYGEIRVDFELLKEIASDYDAKCAELAEARETWQRAHASAHADNSALRAEVERLKGYWTGDKLTGGSDVCHTCAAHCVVLMDKERDIERLRAALEQCNEHRSDPHKIIGIVDAALAGMPPYDFSSAALAADQPKKSS